MRSFELLSDTFNVTLLTRVCKQGEADLSCGSAANPGTRADTFVSEPPPQRRADGVWGVRLEDMAEPDNGRVAVYLDFDNIVLSWYDRVHGRNAFGRDRQKIAENPNNPEVQARLQAALVDVSAIIDYASSFGTLVLTRAYADWSSPVNAEYRSQLVARAVDLVQLFPTAAYAKNGADIRLAIDAVEDMFRLNDLTHIVIVAGDSDYVPLAQRCKRLGRYVVGIGVAGTTARALTAACDEFAMYDSLPGITVPELAPKRSGAAASQKRGSNTSARRGTAAKNSAESVEDLIDDLEESSDDSDERETTMTALLIRALWLGQKQDESGWQHSSAVKQQMRRMDPSFSEKALGFRSFSEFLKSRSEVADLSESGHEHLVRLKDFENN